MTTSLKRAAKAVLHVFSDVDEDTARFQAESGLHCPSGCGACCENARVETTVAELLPLALSLLERGEAQECLARATAARGTWCIFYQQQSPGMGRCGVYALRPAICRLFGFAGVNSRRSGPVLATCWKHRETQPDVVDSAERAVQQGQLPLPLFESARRLVAQCSPEHGRTPMPINQALQLALEHALSAHSVQVTAPVPASGGKK